MTATVAALASTLDLTPAGETTLIPARVHRIHGRLTHPPLWGLFGS